MNKKGPIRGSRLEGARVNNSEGIEVFDHIISAIKPRVNMHTVSCLDPATRCSDCWGETEAATPPADAADYEVPDDEFRLPEEAIDRMAIYHAMRDMVRKPSRRMVRR